MNPVETPRPAAFPFPEADLSDPAGWLAGYFLGRHRLIQAVRDSVLLAARYDWPVLISGETGTGKEMAAQAVHAVSRRRGKPPQVVAVSGLGETAWSTLFGHRRGAFTGADRDHAGVFELANGASLILEDVSDLPIKVQGMLLRAVETGRFRPLGEPQELASDVRVISTTNVSMPDEIAGVRFRADLYQRLSVLRILLPPLREHLSDLEIYVPHFLARAAMTGEAPKAVSEEGLKVLAAHAWPRNVRELEHVLYRACAESKEAIIEAEDLRRVLLDEPTPSGLRKPGRPSLQIDRELLLRVLKEARGNKREAARRLDIAAGTLYRLLKTHRIRPKDLLERTAR